MDLILQCIVNGTAKSHKMALERPMLKFLKKSDKMRNVLVIIAN
jgi:hypothetical protein